MILDGEHRFGLMPQAFHRLVVQIDAVHGHLGRQGFWINGKTVVLRGDLDFAGFQILYRLVRAAMTELELESLSSECLSQNLVAESNAKHRNARIQQRLHFPDNVIQRGGIAGAVGKKNPGGLELQRVGGAGRRR